MIDGVIVEIELKKMAPSEEPFSESTFLLLLSPEQIFTFPKWQVLQKIKRGRQQPVLNLPFTLPLPTMTTRE